jgi:hypothetical protein
LLEQEVVTLFCGDQNRFDFVVGNETIPYV